jgi:hypothetical protein
MDIANEPTRSASQPSARRIICRPEPHGDGAGVAATGTYTRTFERRRTRAALYLPTRDATGSASSAAGYVSFAGVQWNY